ncbi:MAG TPA: hypothetical protein VFP59_14505 [Candidatus Angelobacter sp.]|nr:hypothetical protein [Candidatus Angelobacter sp.]
MYLHNRPGMRIRLCGPGKIIEKAATLRSILELKFLTRAEQS